MSSQERVSEQVTIIVARTMEWAYTGLVLVLVPSSDRPLGLIFLCMTTLALNVLLTRVEPSSRWGWYVRLVVNTVLLFLSIKTYGGGGFGWALGLPMVVGVAALWPAASGSTEPLWSGYLYSFLVSGFIGASQLALGVGFQATLAGLGCLLFVGLISVRLASAYRENGRALATQTRRVLETQSVMEQQSRLSVAGLMAANIAHEINNPLTYAMLNLDMLEDRLTSGPLSDKESVEHLGHVNDALVQITAVIRDFRRMIAKGSDQAVEVLNLPVVVEEAHRILRVSHPHVRFHSEVDDRLLVRVRHHRLLQILVNLFFNAAEAMKELPDGDKALYVSARLQGEMVLLDVEDSGSGVEPGLRGSIFHPFNSTKSSAGGMGLGLAIARSLAQSDEGSLECLDGQHSGALFRLSLPTALSGVVHSERERAVVAKNIRTVPPELQRVLVIDDQRRILTSVSRMLRPRQVLVAGSGQEGLQICASGRIDLVICDVWMPGMTGLEVYGYLRERHPHLSGRFLFITGGVLADDLEEFMSRNHAPYLLKPFRRDELLKVVDELVGSGPPTPQNASNSDLLV